MTTNPSTKYHLKDLHQEIDLYDRKISHNEKYGVYDSETLRTAVTKKLQTRRSSLVKAANELVSAGVQYDEKYLPRSFKTIALFKAQTQSGWKVGDTPDDRTRKGHCRKASWRAPSEK